MGSRGSWEVREFRVAAQGLKKKRKERKKRKKKKKEEKKKEEKKEKRKRKKKEKKKKQGEKAVFNSICTNSRSTATAAITGINKNRGV